MLLELAAVFGARSSGTIDRQGHYSTIRQIGFWFCSYDVSCRPFFLAHQLLVTSDVRSILVLTSAENL